MILTFPYYDPSGKHNKVFQRQLETLRSTFDAICVSAVPPTVEDNAEFVHWLEEQGCIVFHNASNTSGGDRARAALRLATEQAQCQRPIFFGFLGRILFALETEWRTSFLQDIKAYQASEFLIFERSQSAWDTHPSNYREIEQMVSRMFEFLCRKFIELMPCALLLSCSAANTVLSQSISPSYEVWAEWILLAMKNSIPITTKKVDWLAYQHPYWEQVEPDILKQEREASREETVKRIKMNMPVAFLMVEDRFKGLRSSVSIQSG
ncbi:MAG: hypothetical protein ISS49_11020 [Anaerolineae bacterium]|nr:hypothetical protein [Anaerolineae bacterium]